MIKKQNNIAKLLQKPIPKSIQKMMLTNQKTLNSRKHKLKKKKEQSLWHWFWWGIVKPGEHVNSLTQLFHLNVHVFRNIFDLVPTQIKKKKSIKFIDCTKDNSFYLTSLSIRWPQSHGRTKLRWTFLVSVSATYIYWKSFYSSSYEVINFFYVSIFWIRILEKWFINNYID